LLSQFKIKERRAPRTAARLKKALCCTRFA
jgi:hypothetical protein